MEFKNYSHIASKMSVNANDFIAAGGHFNSGDFTNSEILPVSSRKINSLTKVWTENMQWTYVSASSLIEVEVNFKNLLDVSGPRILEIFTRDEDDSLALEAIGWLVVKGDAITKNKQHAKSTKDKLKSFLKG